MLFKVRIKNSLCALKVYSIVFNDGNISFLAYDESKQEWGVILSDNCVPI